MDLAPDHVFGGKYRLTRQLARGGMGAVWRARHVELDFDVALKVLRTDVASDHAIDERFRREAKAAARLQSPHVVKVQDYGVDDGVSYLVMELLEGEDLEDLLERSGSLATDEAVALLVQACEGLEVVHAAGIVHRDIKPSNLFLAKAGRGRALKLLDFGIAKAPASDEGEITRGLVFGSPLYMSPEQARGHQVDARSDLFSLAAVFYRMVVGRAPFEGKSPSDIVVRLCTEDPPRPSSIRPDLDHRVDQIVARGLSRDPAARFPSATAFAAALMELCDPADSRALALFDRREERASGPPDPSRPSGRLEETVPLSLDTGAPPHSRRPKSDSPRKGSPRGRWLLAGAFALVIAVLFYAWRRSEPGTPDIDPSAGPSAAHQQSSQNAPTTPMPAVTDGEANEPSRAEAPPPVPSRETTPRPSGKASKVHTGESRPGPRKSPASQVPAPKETDPVFGLPVEPSP